MIRYTLLFHFEVKVFLLDWLDNKRLDLFRNSSCSFMHVGINADKFKMNNKNTRQASILPHLQSSYYPRIMQYGWCFRIAFDSYVGWWLSIR